MPAEHPRPIGAILRRLAMWSALALIIALIMLSIYGAFIGDDPLRGLSGDVLRARFFNSAPLAGLWVLLLIGLLAGPIAFRGLRRFGPLTLHLGPAMVLIGGLWGSQAVHDFRVAYLGEQRLRDGVIELVEGEPNNLVVPINRLSDQDQTLRELPFSLRLNNFWLDLHDSPRQWWLYLPLQTGPRQFTYWTHPVVLYEPIDLGPDVGSIKPLSYIPAARGVGWLLIDPPGVPATQPATQSERARQPGRLEALPGALARWEDGSSLTVLAKLADYQGVEVPDAGRPPRNPSVFVHVEQPGGPGSVHRIPAGVPHPLGPLGLRYVIQPEPSTDSPQPGMMMAVVGRSAFLRDGDPAAGQPKLLPIVPTGRDEDHVLHTWPAYPLVGPFGPDGKMTELAIALINYRPWHVADVRSFNADVTVLGQDGLLGRQTIRVNYPMQYAGYHFYQQSHDPLRNDYTVLRVVSNAGLGWVYAGYLVMLVGLFWTQWIEPAYRRLRRTRARPGQAGGE